MAKFITAKKGDCFINICNEEGFYWETIWNHPENRQLREKRKNLNIIKKGDRIFIPDLELREEPCETERRHTFCVNGAKVNFTLVLKELGQPRADEKYELVVAGRSRKGVTDAEGTMTEPIPANARRGLLLLGDDREEISIDFGHVDPIDEISGVKTRLQNLGFYEGEIDDELTPETTGAIAEFQRALGISGNGELNDETREALVRENGS